MRREKSGFVLAIIVGIGLSAWLVRQMNTTKPATTAIMGPQTPDYYIEMFNVVTMDKEGGVHHHLQGESLHHYAGSGDALIRSPWIDLKRAGGHWQLKAHEGVRSDEGTRFSFSGSVVVGYHTATMLRMDTENLLYLPLPGELHTNSPIEITSPQTTIKATGMQAHLGSGQIELLAEVTAEHALP